jgi:hypothetical protein
MSDKTNKYWFPAKRYGVGWSIPATWQGWLVLAVYLAAVGILLYVFPPVRNPLAFYAGTCVATLALLLICMFKGEPLRWRSGGD